MSVRRRLHRAAALVLVLVLATAGGCTTPETTGCGADGRGAITFATVKNLTAEQRDDLTSRWQAGHPAEPLEIVELPATADQQRAQLAATLQVGARGDRDGYDVVGLDVVFLPEFARGDYLQPLNEERFAKAGFFPAPWKNSFHGGELFAVPFTTNVGLLYYWTAELVRLGEIPDARTRWTPGDWRSVARVARISHQDGVPGPGGYIGQLAPYEGLTANALELIWAEGGDLPTPTHRVEDAELDAAARGVGFLLDGVRNRWIDEATLGFDEQDSLNAFRSGKALVMRHWPDAWPTLAQSPGAIGVTRLPGEHATVLGGESLAVARCSPNRESAQAFIEFLTGGPMQQWIFRNGLYLPTVERLYSDGSLTGGEYALPADFVGLLRDSIKEARARPAEPAYDRISRLIQSEIHRALQESASDDVDAGDVVAGLAGKLEG
jgi:multiple sugar transport system substrate-binding protein